VVLRAASAACAVPFPPQRPPTSRSGAYACRRRHAQALLAASKGVLQAGGSLKEIERRLNASVARIAGVAALKIVAYYDPGRWYLLPGGTRHTLQVHVATHRMHVYALHACVSRKAAS
jgi:hypothetical protein